MEDMAICAINVKYIASFFLWCLGGGGGVKHFYYITVIVLLRIKVGVAMGRVLAQSESAPHLIKQVSTLPYPTREF